MKMSVPVDSNLKIAMRKFDVLKDQLGLSDVLYKKAIHLYKKINEKNIQKGKSIDIMIAAAIYVVCRNSKTTHTLNDIAEVTGIDKNSIARYYRIILINLNLQMPSSNIKQFVLRIVNDMGLSKKVKQHAITILHNAKKRNYLAGKEPMGIAAAAVYLASKNIGEKTSQQELAKTAMISDVTIRNSYKGLQSISNEMFKSVISVSVEKALLEIGKPEFDLVVSRLKEDYNCEISDCLEHPDYLKLILCELFGNAYQVILKSIHDSIEKSNLERPLVNFLTILNRSD